MDLAPYSQIDPCGHFGLPVVDLAMLGVNADCDEVGDRLSKRMQAHLDPVVPRAAARIATL
jgi:lipoyl(octanoyl) transferase